MAAVEAIELEFEERPPLFDVRKAFDADAPQVHHWGNWYPHFEGEMDRRQIRKGDDRRGVRAGRRDRQGRLPPGRDRARADRDAGLPGRARGRRPADDLLVHAGAVLLDGRRRRAPAGAAEQLKFVGGTVGGGFGGKVDTATETICALLALKSGRPVKWRWTREEEFLCSSTRAPWHMEIADAVTKDGWILGRKMLTLHDSGAYARFSPYGADEAQLPPHRRVHDPEPRSSTATSSSRTACRRPRCAASASRPCRSRSRCT